MRSNWRRVRTLWGMLYLGYKQVRVRLHIIVLHTYL